MAEVANNDVPDVGLKEIGHECAPEPMVEPTPVSDRSGEHTGPAPAYAALMMASSRAGLMAVVDDNGQLVPHYTAVDLLRACKSRWRDAQE